MLAFAAAAGAGALVSTGERPLFDILQDRRFWVVHVVAVPALFVAGAGAARGPAAAPRAGFGILTDRFQ